MAKTKALVATVRIPVTIMVPVPIFGRGARLSDLNEWAKPEKRKARPTPRRRGATNAR